MSSRPMRRLASSSTIACCPTSSAVNSKWAGAPTSIASIWSTPCTSTASRTSPRTVNRTVSPSCARTMFLPARPARWSALSVRATTRDAASAVAAPEGPGVGEAFSGLRGGTTVGRGASAAASAVRPSSTAMRTRSRRPSMTTEGTGRAEGSERVTTAVGVNMTFAMTLASGAVLAGFLGLLLGSFLNVVAYRLPRGESLASPGSHCPSCDTPIRPWDNVPVLSWLWLKGRCRACQGSISARYPVVEASTAVLLVAVVLVKGADRDAWLGLAFVLLLVPVTLIDLDHRIIPNKLMLVGTVVSLAILALTDPGAILEYLIAAAAAGGFLLVAALAYPAGMGMGDVKLAFVMGLFLGRNVGAAMLVALVAGSVVGAAIVARKGAAEGRKTAIPFGPYLAFGGLVGLFAGEPVVDWYLNTFA